MYYQVVNKSQLKFKAIESILFYNYYKLLDYGLKSE